MPKKSAPSIVTPDWLPHCVLAFVHGFAPARPMLLVFFRCRAIWYVVAAIPLPHITVVPLSPDFMGVRGNFVLHPRVHVIVLLRALPGRCCRALGLCVHCIANIKRCPSFVVPACIPFALTARFLPKKLHGAYGFRWSSCHQHATFNSCQRLPPTPGNPC